MGWSSLIVSRLHKKSCKKISSTSTQGSASEEECSRFLDPFFAWHAHQPLSHMLSKPLTYELLHASLDTLNRGSAPGSGGIRT